MEYDIYTDGACSFCGKPSAIGGWAYVVTKKDSDKIVTEHFGKLRLGLQDSNRAEIEAIIQALKFIDNNPNDSFCIYTDCELVTQIIKGLSVTQNNRDMWKEVKYLCIKNTRYNDSLRIKVFHVKQDKQNKNPNKIRFVLNNRSDKLAKMASKNLLIPPVRPLGTEEYIECKIGKLLTREKGDMYYGTTN